MNWLSRLSLFSAGIFYSAGILCFMPTTDLELLKYLTPSQILSGDHCLMPEQRLFVDINNTDFSKQENNFTRQVLAPLANKSEDIISCLTEPGIELCYYSPDERARMNVPAMLIECNNIRALRALLEACGTHQINLFLDNAVFETEMIDDPDNLGVFWNGKKEKTTGYKLIPWLMRKDNCYLLGTYARKNYIQAVKALLEFHGKYPNDDLRPADLSQLIRIFPNHNEIIEEPSFWEKLCSLLPSFEG